MICVGWQRFLAVLRLAPIRGLVFGVALAFACVVGDGRAQEGGARQSLVVTPEPLGNPFVARWPNDPYARNIWDMQVFMGRLYLGAGNSSNARPSSNAGPVPIIRYGTGRGFEEVFRVAEEQVDQFRVFDGGIIIAGHDAREGWEYGNLYRFGGLDWTKERSIPNGIHVYDIYSWGRRWVAAGGSRNQAFDAWVGAPGTWEWEPLQFGANPTLMPAENPDGAFTRQGNGRVNSLFPIGDTLYGSGAVMLDYPGKDRYNFAIATLFAFDGRRAFAPVAALVGRPEEGLQLVGADLFPGFRGSFALGLPQVRRALVLDGTTYYVGGRNHNDHQWIPFGVFAARDVGGARRIETAPGALVYDLLVHDDHLYALSSTPRSDLTFRIEVLRLDVRGEILEPVFGFDAPTFARSFEMFDGDWYFGLGTETCLAVMEPCRVDAVSALSEASGEVWRVRGAVLSRPH